MLDAAFDNVNHVLNLCNVGTLIQDQDHSLDR